MAAAEPDTFPFLLPAPANDPPPPFSSHPEFYAPASPYTLLPPTSTETTTTTTANKTNPSPRGSPANPFRPPQNTLNAQTHSPTLPLPPPSTSTSINHSDNDDTASLSLPPAYTPAARYASEEEYLSALRKWAEGKLYMESGGGAGGKSALVGFYGEETMRERIEGLPPLRRGRKARRKEGAQVGEGRRDEGAREDDSGVGEGERRRKGRGLGGWLRGKRMA